VHRDGKAILQFGFFAGRLKARSSVGAGTPFKNRVIAGKGLCATNGTAAPVRVWPAKSVRLAATRAKWFGLG